MTDIGTFYVRVRPEIESIPPIVQLAGASGRLFQAITKETAMQFTRAEGLAWMEFCAALDACGFGPEAAEGRIRSADSVDDIKVVD